MPWACFRMRLSGTGTVIWTESPNRGFRLQMRGHKNKRGIIIFLQHMTVRFALPNGEAPVFYDARSKHFLPIQVTCDIRIGSSGGDTETKHEIAFGIA